MASDIDLRDIVAIPCPKCGGTKELDWRDARAEDLKGPVSAEASGVHMVECPHCNGVGVIPAFTKG